jgi:methylthioribose-1-phosphate isomerase (EC 5.3.1.23)
MSENIETLRWNEDHFEMIDQRILPADFKYISYTDAVSVADGIRDMVVRGAPAIGCAAAYGVALAALNLQDASSDEFNQGMEEAFEVLAQSRPTAINLFWAIDRMRKKMNESEGLSKEIANALLDEAHEIKREDIEINRANG